MVESHSMRLALACICMTACAPRSQPISNRAAHSLFPAKRADCTGDGWCRFADRLPITATAIWVGKDVVYIAGYRGDDADEQGDTAAIARWDGTAWKTWELTGTVVGSISGRGDQVWASGRNAPVFHLAGDQFV